MRLHVSGEATEAWYADIAHLLVDLVGPWQALVSGGDDHQHTLSAANLDTEHVSGDE